MPEPESVVVMAPNWLGDAVMALPAVADARRSFSGSRLVVAARGAVAGLFRLVPDIDEVVTLEWAGQWRRRRPFQADAARLAEVGADVAVLLPNSFASAWLASRARIPERWGYASDVRRILLTRAVARPKGSRHQGAYYQHLTRALGIESGPLEPRLTVPEEAIDAARALLRDRGWDGERPMIALAPGAAYGTAKRWLPDYVARLVSDLIGRHGATCALVGSRADAVTTRHIVGALDGRALPHVVDLTGATAIDVLGGVFALARACVSNDSGAMHIAAAVGTPLVAVFGPTREHETAPLTRAGGRAEVLTHDVWCRPCMLRDCPIDHRCMTGITPQRVFAAVERVMEKA